jgi:hypothetical protein
MQALKALVIGLGLLVVAGMTGLGYGLYLKASNPDFHFFSADGKGSPAAVKPFAGVALNLAEGCHIAKMQASGKDRLFLLIGPDGPCERVIVVDVKDGRILGAVKAGP